MSRVYNSPAALYSEENLAAALQESGLKTGEQTMGETGGQEGVDKVDTSREFVPVAVTSNPVAKPRVRRERVYPDTNIILVIPSRSEVRAIHP